MNWCWHKWGKWHYAGEYGGKHYQRRRCNKCGKVTQRRIGFTEVLINRYGPGPEKIVTLEDTEETP